MPTPPPPAAPIRIRLLNRLMGHHSVPVALKGHSGRAYGSISRFSPPDNCHAVELTLEQYEAARADLFKAMRMHARRVWEVAVTVEMPRTVAEFWEGYTLAAAGERLPDGAGDFVIQGYYGPRPEKPAANGSQAEGAQKRIAELEKMLEERREAMAEQGIVNLKLREELAMALQSAHSVEKVDKPGRHDIPKWAMKSVGLPQAVEQFRRGYELGMDAQALPEDASKAMNSGHLAALEDVDPESPENQPDLSPVPHGTGPKTTSPSPEPPKESEKLDPLEEEVLRLAKLNDPFTDPPALPEVNDRTPWNELQKIAKAEGVDLKVNNNKPKLLKAIEARRSQPASAV